MENAAAADQFLSFDAFDPGGLGDPKGVFMSDPERADASFRALEFDYDVEGVGPVVVEEYVPTEPIETWDEQVKSALDLNDKPFTHGSSKVVTIRDGKTALLLVSEDGSQSMIQWFEDVSMEMIFFGTKLSPEDALKLVEQL